MVPLNSPELTRLAKFLEKYDFKSTVSQLAGLLTAPSLQANTIRIEILVHLAVAHCRGKRKPGLSEIRNWLNRQLGGTQIAHLEDPVEDVFVTNVETPEGNRRVFEGIWESNDYYVQVVLETLANGNSPQECQDLLIPALALLRLSDCVAERVNLQRWHIEPSSPKGVVQVAPATEIVERALALTFTQKDLVSLGVSYEVLTPFIFNNDDKCVLDGETTGHTTLERYLLVDFDGELILVLPNAVSPAIRRFVLSELKRMGHLDVYGDVLSAFQARQVEKDGLWELKELTESLVSPEHKGLSPSLHGWVLKYDINKYLHVVLLHDRLDELVAKGLSSFLKYPEALREGLECYLNDVAVHCQSLADFTEGMSLLIIGGLGRGFELSFNNWPDEWRMSVLRISDLLMLAGGIDQPVTRYLKCIKQKEWAEKENFKFLNINGDFNFYCYWRRMDYQLIPRELPVGEGSILSIGNDMVQPVRVDLRKLMDNHVLQTTIGSYTPVTRFGRDSYFRSMQSRPIYASLSHLREGVLAGVVETQRGPYWLLIVPREGDDRTQHLLYEMWSGFLGLYDRLVLELESVYPQATTGSIEIRLNFVKLIVSENYIEPKIDIEVGVPSVVVNHEQRYAEIIFPSDFLAHFQQPDNVGEKLVLRSIANGLVSLYQCKKEEINETILDGLMSRVIGDSGMRVLHLFRTYSPIELLQARKARKLGILAHEDFVFSKLRLSDDCTELSLETSITSKAICNDFLHNVVDKIWNQLREQLRGLDRTSVVCEMLLVHEAVIRDREHWSRTAQAVIALYKRTEDVLSVAQDRESDRNNISLPARTIIEMAICECPAKGGRQLSQWALDELLAKAALLIEVAMDSDAVNSDFIEPRIYLHANGEYTIDRNSYEAIIKPFMAAYFRKEFKGAAGDYSKLYQNEQANERTRVDEVFSSDFISAFQAEFDLSPDEVVDGLAILMELAVECDNVVVETTFGYLKSKLTAVGGLSLNAYKAFIRTFCIFHRPAWDIAPVGFKNKDLSPWRFRRRLSAIVRPIFIFGEKDDDRVLYGVGALRLGLGYLMERSERGHLPQEFFMSTEMKRYIGAVNSVRGHEFARTVAEVLHNNGWNVRNEVQMTELGASAQLGDVDVLAWKSNGEIQLIECKRLQLARTVAEVAEICRRFRGETKDELDKHMQRVNWIKANTAGLAQVVGFSPEVACIEDRLVTNTHVPMMYLNSLPIPCEKIGPLDDMKY